MASPPEALAWRAAACFSAMALGLLLLPALPLVATWPVGGPVLTAARLSTTAPRAAPGAAVLLLLLLPWLRVALIHQRQGIFEVIEMPCQVTFFVLACPAVAKWTLMHPIAAGTERTQARLQGETEAEWR